MATFLTHYTNQWFIRIIWINNTPTCVGWISLFYLFKIVCSFFEKLRADKQGSLISVQLVLRQVEVKVRKHEEVDNCVLWRKQRLISSQ